MSATVLFTDSRVGGVIAMGETCTQTKRNNAMECNSGGSSPDIFAVRLLREGLRLAEPVFSMARWPI